MKYEPSDDDRRRARELVATIEDAELRRIVEHAAACSLAKVRAVGVAPPWTPSAERPKVKTLSLEGILEALDAWFPGPPLRARLAAHYELDPVRVSRLTTAVLDTPGVRDPCAVLYTRLGELELGET